MKRKQSVVVPRKREKKSAWWTVKPLKLPDGREIWGCNRRIGFAQKRALHDYAVHLGITDSDLDRRVKILVFCMQHDTASLDEYPRLMENPLLLGERVLAAIKKVLEQNRPRYEPPPAGGLLRLLIEAVPAQDMVH